MDEGTCTSEEAGWRSSCWQAAAQLVPLLVTDAGPAAAAAAAAASSMADAARGWGAGGVLPEERELLGYEPINGPNGWQVWACVSGGVRCTLLARGQGALMEGRVV